MNAELILHYRANRSTYPARPAIALARAREDMAKGVKRYSAAPFWSCRNAPACGGAPFNGGLRWIEDYRLGGFRWSGWSDEIARREGYFRSICHMGWFTDSDWQDSVLRGCVLQLPARNGVPLYFAGYRDGSEGCNGWQDSAYLGDHGAAVVDMSESYDSPWEAARAADELARIEAEKQRDYNDAWQAANRWHKLADELATARRDAKALVADMRAAIKAGLEASPRICQALRAQLRSQLRGLEKLRSDREELADSFYYWENGVRVSINEFAI